MQAREIDQREQEDAYGTDIVDDLVPGAIVLNFRVGDVGDDTTNGLADEVVLLVTEVLEDGGFEYGLVRFRCSYIALSLGR